MKYIGCEIATSATVGALLLPPAIAAVSVLETAKLDANKAAIQGLKDCVLDAADCAKDYGNDAAGCPCK